MCGTTVEGAYSFCLVHTEGGAHQRSVVKVFGVAVSALAVEHLTHVIRAIQLTSVLKRSYSQLLNVVHRQIEVFPVVSVVGMAVELHLIGLVVRTSWVVHHHDESAVELVAHHLLEEFLRGICLGFSHSLSILVAMGVGELRGRFADGEGEHAIYRCEHLGLSLLDVSSFLAFSHHLAQYQSVLPQSR